MRRDPLAALARLRAVETRLARRDLATAMTAQADAERSVAAAEDALRREGRPDGPLARDAAAAVLFGAWIPHALAGREAALRAADAARADTAAQREELAAARAGERLVEAALARRAAEARRERLARDGARLDDLPRRPAAKSLPQTTFTR